MFVKSPLSAVVWPDWWSGWCLSKSPRDAIRTGRQNGPPCHLTVTSASIRWETRFTDLHVTVTLTWPDTVRQPSPLLFFCLSPGFVLEAWPIRLQQIPHNSDNGGKKWLSPASNRCVPATDRNITCSQFGDCIVTITIIAIIIIMIMYFNWGDVTLLQAVLICDTATTFQSHQMMSWVSDIKAYTNQFEMQL